MRTMGTTTLVALPSIVRGLLLGSPIRGMGNSGLSYQTPSFVPFHLRSTDSVRLLSVLRGGGGEEEEEIFLHHEEEPMPFVEFPSFHENNCNDNKDDNVLPKACLILMDNFSPFHGQYLSYMAREVYGVAVVSVLSGYMVKGLMLQMMEDGDDDTTNTMQQYLRMRIPDVNKEREWASQIIPSNTTNNTTTTILGIVCESDSGLASAERLGAALQLYPDVHDGINRGRRDKYEMNRQLERYGLRTVQQQLCHTLEEALNFHRVITTTTNTTSVILKPTRGVASESVFLCSNADEIQHAFDSIHSSPVFGSGGTRFNTHVLVQEYAVGTEYAIDMVSQNGTHKVAALWRYDKRPVNNAPFVYHATRLVDSSTNATTTAIHDQICNYAMDSLDALKVRWGLSHIEVMLLPNNDNDNTSNTNTNKDCVLIEVNCRQHNTDFAPMTTMCIGYNALDMLLSAYLGDYYYNHHHNDPAVLDSRRLDWDALPTMPQQSPLMAQGAIVHLVCHVEGRVTRIDGLDILEHLESVRNYEIYPSFMVNQVVSKTTDIRTDAGWVHLIHEDEIQFQQDYDTVMGLMEHMFVVE